MPLTSPRQPRYLPTQSAPSCDPRTRRRVATLCGRHDLGCVDDTLPSSQQVLEVVLQVAWYKASARIMVPLRIELEDEYRTPAG